MRPAAGMFPSISHTQLNPQLSKTCSQQLQKFSAYNLIAAVGGPGAVYPVSLQRELHFEGGHRVTFWNFDDTEHEQKTFSWQTQRYSSINEPRYEFREARRRRRGNTRDCVTSRPPSFTVTSCSKLSRASQPTSWPTGASCGGLSSPRICFWCGHASFCSSIKAYIVIEVGHAEHFQSGLFFAETFRSFFRNSLKTCSHLSFSDIFWPKCLNFFRTFQRKSIFKQKLKMRIKRHV